MVSSTHFDTILQHFLRCEGIHFSARTPSLSQTPPFPNELIPCTVMNACESNSTKYTVTGKDVNTSPRRLSLKSTQ